MNEPLIIKFDGPEFLLRASDDDGKTLTGYAVPWDRPTYVDRPIAGYEVFRKGALTRSVNESKTPILLKAEHNGNRYPVGKLVRSEADAFGQLVEFRMFENSDAQAAGELVREGVWTGLSIEAYGVEARTKTDQKYKGLRLVERQEVRWTGVALTGSPAYEDAKVLALRSTPDFAIQAAARKRIRARKFA